MNVKHRTQLAIAVCTAGLLLVPPLSAETENSKSGYTIDVVHNASSNAKIIKPTLRSKNGKLWIMGKLKRQNRHQRVPFGHIDINIFDKNGKRIIDQAIGYSPTRVHKETLKASQFVLQLQTVPPKGSVIKLSYHKNAFKRSYTGFKHDSVK